MALESETPPRKTVVLIDGYNLYHALQKCFDKSHGDQFRFRKYKWLDYRALAERYVSSRGGELVRIEYFTAPVHYHAKKNERQGTYVAAQKDRGVNVTLGKIKMRGRKCPDPECRCKFEVPEEKQTDTNLAIALFELAYKNLYDEAIIITADSDILPAVRAVQRNFKNKSIGVVIPIGREMPDEFKKAVRKKHVENGKQVRTVRPLFDFKWEMTVDDLEKCQLPDPYTRSDGTQLHCPATWKEGTKYDADDDDSGIVITRPGLKSKKVAP